MGKRMSYYLKSTIVLALLLCSVLAVKVNVQARTLNVNEMKENFSTLQSQYPTGQKWNGSFQGAWQCHGFGLLVFDRLFQTKANDLPIISNPSDFFVGDLVRFRNGSYNHTFVITDIIDNTIYYVDCNSDNRNTVVWGHTISKDRVRTLISQPLLPGFGDKTLTSGYVKHQDGNNITSLSQFDTEAPVVFNAVVTDRTKDGYTVTVDVSDNVGIDRVEFTSWYNEPGGQENSKMHRGVVSDGKATCRIDINELGGREGDYFTHIWAFDTSGKAGFVGTGTFVDKTSPVVKNARISEKTRDGYLVTVDISDNFGIDRVEFTSWINEPGGESHSKMHRGEINGSTVTFRVDINELGGKEGEYFTHIWAYDTSKNNGFVGTGTFIDRTPPTISNASIIDRDSTGYTISCTVMDNEKVDRVQFPSWTSKVTNGDWQDDIIPDWTTNPLASGIRKGNTFTYRVNDSDHNYEHGEYNTHIYAYDIYGNHSVATVPATNLENTYKFNNNIQYNGHEYYLFEDLLSWDDAKKQCERMGGYLVTITSQEEQSAVSKLLAGAKRRGYFLGASDLNSKSSFAWITGEPFNYSNWNPGEPSHSDGIEHYIELLNDEGRWNDVSNTVLNRGFILEKVVTNKIQNVVINPTNIALKAKAATAQLKATISPANATNKTVTWKSSNPSVATVDQNGKVTAVSNGTANITVTTQDGNKTATCKVTINIPKPVTPDKPSVSATSIKLNKPSLTLYKGKTYTLKATVKPKTHNSGVKWSSSANKYATVSSKGKITAKKSGRTVITAQTKNGKKATCIIKVKERKATKVKLSRKSLTLKVGRKYALKATVYPKNTTDTKKWTINKKGIVKVSSKGVVTGLKKGKCRITLKTSSGKSAYCNVKVE